MRSTALDADVAVSSLPLITNMRTRIRVAVAAQIKQQLKQVGFRSVGVSTSWLASVNSWNVIFFETLQAELSQTVGQCLVA